MFATDAAIAQAKVDASNQDGPVKHKGFTIKTWRIEGYGWTGEIEDSGANRMPPWMNPAQPFEYRWQAVEFMRDSIDAYILLVNEGVAR